MTSICCYHLVMVSSVVLFVVFSVFESLHPPPSKVLDKKIIIIFTLKKLKSKRGSRCTVHAAISLRWSVNQLLACLYKDNGAIAVSQSLWEDPLFKSVLNVIRKRDNCLCYDIMDKFRTNCLTYHIKWYSITVHGVTYAIPAPVIVELLRPKNQSLGNWSNLVVTVLDRICSSDTIRWYNWMLDCEPPENFKYPLLSPLQIEFHVFYSSLKSSIIISSF